ncbi:MAG TPA: phosphatidate cytidylyltransferase [Thermomicrobiales bacterium]|nr:phosphatidate cytidylyltransferase [Thermomicrobiales bacterium]
MRTRAVSSLGVIAVGVIAGVIGGPVFAAVMAAIGLGVYYETSRITPLIGLGYRLEWPGYVVIFLGASISLLSQEPWSFASFISIAVLLPTVMILQLPVSSESFAAWITTAAVGAYVGIAVFAAIALRQEAGILDAEWANDVGTYFSVSDDSYALGMAWTAIAIVVAWLSDTFAFLVGHTMGRTPLIPHISPKKTLEGAVGGVLGAVIGTVTLTLLLGIPDVSVAQAIVIGVVLSIVGVGGDLSESFIKRCGGVKDSGTLIPGHGGIFDRVDALLPIFLVTWVIVRILQ